MKIKIYCASEIDVTHQATINEIKKQIDCSNLVIIKNLLPEELLTALKAYTHQVGVSSLPSYHPIELHCPDHHRIINNDPRAHVASCMHLYSFYPWNQNVFNLFHHCQKAFQLRNILSDIDDKDFLNRVPTDDYVPRIAIQHYPAGGGFLAAHKDPVWELQKINISIQLSQINENFNTGGLFFQDDGEQVMVDEHLQVGDAALFPAQANHGVTSIDSDKELSWLSPEGRWSLLPTYVPTQKNNLAANSVSINR